MSEAAGLRQPETGAISTGDSEGDEQSSTDESPRTKPTQTRLFELLSNQRRRYTLHYLKQADGRAELSDLAEQVAAWENRKTLDEVTSTERKNVYSSLQQFHLPKLEEEEIVGFDSRSGAVTVGPSGRGVDIYMEVVDSGEMSWSQYYLALAGVGGLLLAAGTYGVAGFSPAGAGIIVVTALAISAICHGHYSRTEMRLGTGERPPDREKR